MSETEVKQDLKLGVKESLEALEMLRLVGLAAAKIASDRKVSVGDLKHIADLAKDFNKLIEGAKGLDKVDDEFKDLDAEEAKQLISKVFAIIKELRVAGKRRVNESV